MLGSQKWKLPECTCGSERASRLMNISVALAGKKKHSDALQRNADFFLFYKILNSWSWTHRPKADVVHPPRVGFTVLAEYPPIPVPSGFSYVLSWGYSPVFFLLYRTLFNPYLLASDDIDTLL